MKTKLALQENFENFGFDTMSSEDMKLVSGGGEAVIVFDPETGEFKVIIRPTRP